MKMQSSRSIYYMHKNVTSDVKNPIQYNVEQAKTKVLNVINLMK